jgi:cytochrome c oxidase subunit 2
MKFLGWAIALAAAGLTPATAQAPTAAAPPAVTNAAPASTAAPAPAVAAVAPEDVAPTPGIGVPDGRKGIQYQVTPIGHEAQAFHDKWLLPLCVVISLFVLGLLGYAMVKFRRGANPTPSRTSHNIALEVAWTLVPVLILVGIAVPSIRLLSHQYSPPKADLTIKVIGNQWYWTYQYPDNGGIEIVSNILKEKGDATPGQRFRTDADGPPLLAVDERMVIPVGKVVKFIITSTDVIHSFAVPAFWTKLDANPGKLNETWVKVEREGVYFGQCSELCGARHGYMPIAVEVVPEATFNAWIASKGGTPKGAKPSIEAVSAEAAPAPTGDNAAVEQPVTNQAVVAQN